MTYLPGFRKTDKELLELAYVELADGSESDGSSLDIILGAIYDHLDYIPKGKTRPCDDAAYVEPYYGGPYPMPAEKAALERRDKLEAERRAKRASRDRASRG